MNVVMQQLCRGDVPFCIIQKQDSEDLLLLKGTAHQYDVVNSIPRQKEPTNGTRQYDTISVIPFCQIKERGYQAHDDGEKIRTIKITDQHFLPVDQFLPLLPDHYLTFAKDIEYDSSQQEYERLITSIVEDEIGNGEGANFVIPINGSAKIESFSTSKAFSIFGSLLTADYGTYWKFLFYDTELFFIGSTPERHLLVEDGRVKMNPISGTFRKDRRWEKRADFKRDLLSFLQDEKEINELFMVVDEELKMMAKMCGKGGTIVGPLLKEMSQLIHSEYILTGESDKDIFELFVDSMFAATVVGSPVENACNIIKKYSKKSRRYYGSALLLVGRDEEGRDFLDSPITIRTAEISTQGDLYFSVGATLVKDSNPQEELLETKAKASALLSAITGQRKDISAPVLPKLYNDDDIAETLVERNRSLSDFWFFKQDRTVISKNIAEKIGITIIHNEDDFAYMLDHLFSSMGFCTSVVRYDEYIFINDTADITVLGPGPGNPTNVKNRKIATIRDIAEALVMKQRKSIFVCLGHQVLCSVLGYEIMKKVKPLQGSQVEIDLFGQRELVGFYNTFVPENSALSADYDVSVIEKGNELIAIKGQHFTGFQFHPESILTKNGFTILEETVRDLLAIPA